jgi:D-sedoheptulose 7-phosphate isomerase
VAIERGKRLVPIPNPEAKPLIADNTASFRCGNVGRCLVDQFLLTPLFYNHFYFLFITFLLAFIHFSNHIYAMILFYFIRIFMKEYIKDQIKKSYETKQSLYSNEPLLNAIIDVAQKCVSLYKNGKKTLLAGNGGSAADAQHIAAELVGRYGFDRPSIPSLALTTDTSNLTAIGNDYGYDYVFSRQLEGMGQEGDLFIGISTSGNSKNIVNAFISAKKKGITTVALVGRDGGEMAKIADISLIVPSDSTPRIQESHILIGHILCDIIEKEMFAEGV